MGTPSSYTITVNPTDNPAFNYTPSTLCQTGTDPLPVITGGAAGTFTASPVGLVFIDVNTGQIDVSASALGAYTVTFTTNGICPSSSTAIVNITLAPAASFSYAGPYCPDGIDPTPTFDSVSSAGTFSSTPGLVFVSNTTGQVDLSASTAGSYTVSYIIPAGGGCATVTATTPITITATPIAPEITYISPVCASAGTASPLHTTIFAGTITVGVGLIVIVFVAETAAQPPAAAILLVTV